ncbi:MAG: hypothetical protein K6B39_07975 [Lachnospiraceae bacterium]|nr:hypothetical protein [Lachnospiraceae bacterium]
MGYNNQKQRNAAKRSGPRGARSFAVPAGVVRKSQNKILQKSSTKTCKSHQQKLAKVINDPIHLALR